MTGCFPVNDGSVNLLPKEKLSCSKKYQDELEKTFGKLFQEVVKLRDRASLAYPIGFW